MEKTRAIIFSLLAVFSIAVAPITIGFGGWDDGWSDGWDDGWSDGWDDGTSGGWDGEDPADSGTNDGSSGGDPLDDGGETIDWPPVWNTLDDQQVDEDSTDYTVVYPNLANECIDPDGGSVSVSVVSHAPNYNLDFLWGDLVIYNLQPDYWDSGNIVSLDCNGVASFFVLTIAPVNDAPQIVNLSSMLETPVNQVLTVDLSGHEYDVDNSPAELSWTITSSQQPYFDAQISGKTLEINPTMPGVGTITLRLEDPTGAYDEQTVQLRVLPSGDDYVPPALPEDDTERFRIFVSSIRINGDGRLFAGEKIEGFLTLTNSGDLDLEDIRVAMVIQDIALRGTAGPFDLDKGETTTRMVRIDVDDTSVLEGKTYDVRFTISNDDSRRVVYREVDVEFA